MYTNISTPKTTCKRSQDDTYFLVNHMYDNMTGKKQSIDTLLETNPKIWGTVLSNKLG